MHATDIDTWLAGTRALPMLAIMGLIFALSSRSVLPAPPGLPPGLTAKAGHFCLYAALAGVVWRTLSTHIRPGRLLSTAFVSTVTYGASDEWHQSFVRGRDPALLDLAADAAGAACALAAVLFIQVARKQRTA